MPEQPIEPYSQLRRALAYIHAHAVEHGGWGCDTVEVDVEELEALLAERTRLRERIHQVVDEQHRRYSGIQSERDALREQQRWGLERLRDGGERYASWSKVAVAMGVAEELARAYELIRLCGGYLSKIGGDDDAQRLPPA